MAAYVKPRWNRRRGGQNGATGRWAHTYGAIDLGTNNCRLLVARPARSGFRVVDAFSRIIRLGEGLSESGQLSDAAMERAVDALKICASKMRRRDVNRGRFVTTDACRRAENTEHFLKLVLSETGLKLETISPEEEAGLALKGCLPLLRPDLPSALIFDIGGGSTEVMYIESRQHEPSLTGWISLPFGVVNLSERHGVGPFSHQEYETMVDEVAAFLEPFCEKHRISEKVRDGDIQLLGTSGTVTTLTGVHMNLPRYNRSKVDGAFLGFEAIRDISDSLRRSDCDRRAAHPCIGRERADLVVAGCAILEAICRQWPVGELRVADRGLREGILLDLIRDADLAAMNGTSNVAT